MSDFWDTVNLIDRKKLERLFFSLYGIDEKLIIESLSRYQKIVTHYRKLFPEGTIQLFSTPGRTEIGGNHTDHNGGRVLAASVHLDSICAASKTDNGKITIYSEGFSHPFNVTIQDLAPKRNEEGTTAALIRGIMARFMELGYEIGGYNAYISSNVGIGSGLSSSASIEVLLGTILNTFYNDGRIGGLKLAQIGQYAENIYFKKPCGLMDQVVCAFGGVVSIDFADFEDPIVKQVEFNFSDLDYCLLVVNTGSGHEDLTEDYKAVTDEMRMVAAAFGSNRCREISIDDLEKNMGRLRSQVSDRAILRAYHFLTENERVRREVEALEKGDFNTFLDIVSESGNSSSKWLQNSFSTKNPLKQGISLALAITESFLRGRKRGAYRVHGGGFAGTIQVFIHRDYIVEYIELMERVFGRGSVTELLIRPYGTIHLNMLLNDDGN